MKVPLITLASVVTLLASVTLVGAQGPGGGDPGGAAPGGGPTAGAGADPGGAPAGPGGAGGESMGGPEQGGASSSETGEEKGAPESKGAATKSDDAGTSKGSTAEKQDLKDEDQDAGTKRATRQDREPEKGTSAEGKRSGDSAAEGKSTGEAGEGGAVQLSGEKRTEVQKAFGSHKGSAKVDLDVDVAVGVTVPRHVHLVVIPDDILVIVPGWRRYRYIVVGDVICIIDPDTFVIVEVIHLA
jgi:uncharacterized protein DUF1236